MSPLLRWKEEMVMRFYQQKLTNDLFILMNNAPQWLHTYVDGRHSKEARTPMYCRLVPTGEIALVHLVEWFYTDDLTEIDEEEARALDSALVDRIARIEGGEEVQLSKRTKYHGYLKEDIPE
jgi:hypothetical protein